MQTSTPPPRPSRGPLIALVIGLLLIVGGLIATLVWGLASFNQPRAIADTPVAGNPIGTAQPVRPGTNNRIAVIDGDQIYTIDPDGGQRVALDVNGSVPTDAVIWSHDNTRLIFATTTSNGSQLVSMQPDNSGTQVLYQADRVRVPFYLYGSPDDRHVAFLQTDPDSGSLNLQVTDADPTGTQSIAIGSPNYYSWSPASDALLLHVGGSAPAAFIGTYQLGADAPKNIAGDPALFQSPMWSPIDQHWLYARNHLEGGQLIVSDGVRETAVLTFPVGIAFGWSPDARHIAYTYNDPTSFDYSTLSVIEANGQAAHQYFSGDIIAFFWSPDSTKLAYLTGAVIEPGPVGRAGGLAALRIDGTPLRVFIVRRSFDLLTITAASQQATLQLNWHVIDLATQQTIDLAGFEPSDGFVYILQYFDQFAQSIEVWSPDSQALVFTGAPLGGQSGVYVLDTTNANSQPKFIGPGDFAIWSWR